MVEGEAEVSSRVGSIFVVLGDSGEVFQEQNLGELHKEESGLATAQEEEEEEQASVHVDNTYLSAEPVCLEGPEDGESVEHEGVGVRSEVTGEETHILLLEC